MEEVKQKGVDDLISRCIAQSSNSVREYLNSVPIDLLIDIFSRVQPKSIGRFRCVSKLWASILVRPDFTALARPCFLFGIKVNQYHSSEELLVFSAPPPRNLDENASVVATRHKSFPKYFPTEICSVLCGSVFLHGWIGIGHRVVCNPLTGESITLPKLKVKGLKRSYLCFDPLNKQFKVLCSITGSPNTHQVLTLETGKRLWRTIQGPVLLHNPVDEKCINGVLYYLVYFGNNSLVIFCFNVRSEKFGVINRDKDMLYQEDWSLFNYKGKLGAHCFTGFDSRQKELVLWALEDAGKHKWSKTICVLPPLWYETIDWRYNIVGMTSTGEIVFSPYHLSNPFYLFYYNVKWKTFTRVDIQGLDHHISTVSTYFLDYVENIKLM